MLAAKSLECITEDYILDISHMGIVSEALEDIAVSEKGRKAFEHHAEFHKEMIQGIRDELNPEEIKVLVQALTKLDRWFRQKEKEN